MACRAVALIGTLDTKGDEIAYVRDRLAALGVGAVVIDSGILGEPTIAGRRQPATRSPRAAGYALDDVRAAGSRGAAVALMREGVREVVVRLFADGARARRALPRRRRGRPAGRDRDAGAPGRRAEAAGVAVRLAAGAASATSWARATSA